METEFNNTYRSLLYEPRRLRINEALIALISCATPAVIVSFAGAPWLFIALGVTCPVAVATARRAFRIRLLVTDDAVQIFNYWQTHHFPWSEVKAVHIGEEAGRLASTGAWVRSGHGQGALRPGDAVPSEGAPRVPGRRIRSRSVFGRGSTRCRRDDRDKALSNLVRRGWMRGQPPRQTNRLEGDRMVWLEQPLFAPISRSRKM